MANCSSSRGGVPWYFSVYTGMSTGIGIIRILFRKTCWNFIGVCGFPAVVRRHNLTVVCLGDSDKSQFWSMIRINKTTLRLNDLSKILIGAFLVLRVRNHYIEQIQISIIKEEMWMEIIARETRLKLPSIPEKLHMNTPILLEMMYNG